MAKRYTDTEKWESQFFCDLSPDAKLIYLYILDRCDQAGVWKGNWALAKFFAGSQMSVESLKQELRVKSVDKMSGSEKFVELDDGKIWVVNFLKFQNPTGLSSQKPMVVGIRSKIGSYSGLTEIVKSVYPKGFLPEEGEAIEQKKSIESRRSDPVETVSDSEGKAEEKAQGEEKKPTGLRYARALISEIFEKSTEEDQERVFHSFDGYYKARQKNRKAMSDRAVLLLLNKTKPLGIEKAIEAIDEATEKGWSSIFPKDSGVTHKKGEYENSSFEEEGFLNI